MSAKFKREEEKYEKHWRGTDRVWPNDKFVKGGFSHQGGGDKAICPDCHLEPRLQKGTDYAELHKELRPDCSFVRKYLCSTGNQTTMLQRKVQGGTASGGGIATAIQATGAQDPRTTLRNKLHCETCGVRLSCIMFRPCRHLYSCGECAEKDEACKLCGSTIERKDKIFRS